MLEPYVFSDDDSNKRDLVGSKEHLVVAGQKNANAKNAASKKGIHDECTHTVPAMRSVHDRG